MKWPATLFASLRLARNVYNAWSSYTAARDRVEWLRKHASGSEIVGIVKSLRYETDPQLSGLERWEQWQTTDGSSTS